MQTTERITLTLRKEVAEHLRRRVAEGDAESVSGYVTSIIEQRFERELVARFLDDMAAEGGLPTEEDVKRVDELMRLARGA